MIRVAIIGGGISGLTTAFYLEQERRRGAPVSYVVFEAEPRLGGVIRTERVNGCLVEAGPDSFLTSKPWARELCEDLRLSSQLMGSRDSARKTYIVVDGQLQPIPPGMQMMVPTRFASVVSSSLFSAKTKLAMMREYLWPPEPLAADDDESVTSFISRHFNAEVVERLAEPLLAGVYGGEASSLSVRATLQQMVDSECRFRSLVRGALIARKSQNREQLPPPLFTTMRDGMQRMVDAIVRHVPREMLRCSRAAERLAQNSGCWQVSSAGVTEEFDQVILALPARACAKLLATVPGSERAVELLNEIGYSSALTVALGYKATELALPPGFGFLVPRNEARRIMACTFVDNKFESRTTEGMTLLRVFMGGTRDPEALDLSDDQIVEIVRRELREIAGIAAEPQFTRIYRWPHAMPQYEVGHLLRVARLEMHMQRLPGLQLSGNAYHGIGIPDCVRIGRSAADAVMRKLRSQQAPVG